ncbi:AAA family ATPase [Acetobacter oeni]|uniref:DNA repair ATPase n=1 Tax=Acetobacter oeni TaxID=304077 RepID=A0A511XH54_9PROT|nr:AAA family ATPase [Acetobacter oeni]MBB3882418.1 uncharacterized protein YhaN [Acetobacter oeni]NHO18486.1 hypothetical protein [Acetobacter oeni]GBR00480.1 hypothetical protein AA21952_0114 [Acetobacter oeni LMG 21952]GEN62275.1 DNA repair ATPase [Acetobacter oeni]
MTLRISHITVENFRKFRAPVTIDGLTDGLNILIEPNETGKSTLLEALRAAFFVRYGTKNQLTRSYAPHGDSVGPEIQVDFTIDNAPWSLTKRFLKSPSVEVTSPEGRAQGEEAESRLHTLLGSVKDTSTKGDIASWGILGLLWIGQTEALSLTAPGSLVRDTVRSILEAEVGAVLGGPAWNRVHDRVGTQYDQFWTATGKEKGKLTEARKTAEDAQTEAETAKARLQALEENFTALEQARAGLKRASRDIADETDIQTRKDLEKELEIARAAGQILATRRAEKEAATSTVKALTDLQTRHQTALKTHAATEAALTKARDKRRTLATDLVAVREKTSQTKETLEQARLAQRQTRAALAEGQKQHDALRRHKAIAAARTRYAELSRLEQELQQATALSATLIPPEILSELEKHEKRVAEAQARVTVGATRLTLSGDTAAVTFDSQPATAGEHSITRDTTIRVGNTELRLRPPASTASAEQDLSEARRKRDQALEDLGLRNLTDARLRNDKARDATAECRTLQARIDAATPADDTIALKPGPQALKLFIAGLPAEDPQPPAETPDLPALTSAVEHADTTLSKADGTHQSAIEALRRLETEDAPFAAAEAGAQSDLSNATARISELEKHPDFASLNETLAQAGKRAAESAAALEEATRNATVHDQTTIKRKIDTIDARVRTARETCRKLETEIAKLEGTIESEGGKGLAGREAAAREAVEAARAALHRVTEDAETIKLLRNTLEDARRETSARFTGPVAERMKQTISRLMPGSDLSFSEDLALDTLIRGDTSEDCTTLSRGTQEQLAILTRIAFADMLREQGLPVSLILDDPLAYSDDGRLELLIDIIADAAKRMQVILLTCRERAFRHVTANHVSLT